MRVHVWGELNDEARKALDGSLPTGVEVTVGEEVPGNCEILVKGVVQGPDLEGLGDLKAVIVPWAGLSARTRKTLLDRPDLPVYNLHHNAGSTAETAVSLLLACSRRTALHDRRMRTGSWRPRYEDSKAVLLSGKKMVVLGYGNIGRRVAQAGLALGMKVTAVRKSGPFWPDRGVEIEPVNQLDELLKEAAALMVCVPLTEETEGMIGEKQLGLMPETGIVVNVGRGPVIQEKALFDAVKSGGIFSCGMDVWWRYPADTVERAKCPPGEMPWHELDNVVMSPHVGGAFRGNEPERMRALGGLVGSIENGDAEDNRVDPQRGY